MSTTAEQVPKGAEVVDRKRKQEEDASADASSEPEAKVPKVDSGEMKPMKRGPISKAREIRLEQNRKAARESRRRKKVMIEELQRSVIFFSRSNGVLKQQNEDLQRMLLQAQAQVAQIEGRATNAPSSEPAPATQTEAPQQQHQQTEAETVAAQAVYESQGFPPAAARAAAQTVSGSNAANEVASASASPVAQNVPQMQPGATMQAMANFQQAAAAAMQAAVQGMQGIPGLSVSALTAAPPNSANPQQAYNDTMTALAMQQAAAAAGQPTFFQQNPFMPIMAWQGQQPPAGGQQPAPATPGAQAAPATQP
mmetsp:Transcript_43456/g.125616  ORF Transcript_43456/g.125616 Transcript_43456/m.125616 type:complete len:310 (-) Transcript_43456:87-1016(-)|eukprot:CAMPEP_0176064752 /NCGR_PEP_ID=MMETSP0120_2-20121206/32300_1 /TAXON_ID=160619 /ORGANISM="Kryptoperidinium foliaceum, Strain CCMP 1326" /LENGTH=309 /DNA_ID=CAMNT_0017398333 /DNA_START=124 /DNA_END=1053 /DNA_ORIENTATION=+